MGEFIGNLLGGAAQGGSSGSLGYGKGNSKTQNTYLAESANQRPLEDIMGLLAQEANQQRAQRNLTFGGGGYGGSFETEAQKAQRAAGQPVDNSKPYGGWGGYGSDNPVMSWDPTNTRPDWATTAPPGTGAPPTTGPTTPIPPRTPPGVPTTGPGGVRTDTGDGGGVPGDPRGPVVTGNTPPRRLPVTPDPGGPEVQTRAEGGGSLGDGGSQWDDPRSGDAFYRSEMKKQEAGNKATEAYGQQANAAYLSDPKIKATYAGLKGLGYNKYLPDVGELAEVFSTTDLQPEDLLKHYGILIQNKGGDENRVGAGGHGAEFRNMAAGLGEKLGAGLYGKPAWSSDEDAANPVQPSERPKSQFAGVPFDPLGKAGVAPTAGGKSYDAQQAKWDRSFGKAKANAAAPAAARAAVAPDGRGDVPVGPRGAPPAATSSRFGAAPGSVERSTVQQEPPQNPSIGDTWTDRNGQVFTYGSGGWTNDRGDIYIPPKGAPGGAPPVPGDPEGPRGTEPGGGRDGNGGPRGPLQQAPPDVDGTGGPDGGPTDDDTNPDLLPDGTHPRDWGRPSQFGPQGFNPTIDPKTGKPMDPATQYTQPGYAGGDAWSTSAPWRPEEPTGGLYGAYSELAGGNLTPYENRIMEGWQGRATNPMGWADEKTLSSIDTYEKTPGRGEDEAYGAYNDMLKGGYSAAEQNAITQEGMRAARAGFETNRDAMLRNQARTGNSAGYAANMAKMARGFGETMGSQGRQNQIDFANEAQRRKEGGASGMLNVAGLANQRGQTSIAARQGFGNELSRRQETAMGGMQQAAGYGRDLQQKGLQGLQGLYDSSDPTKQWATAAGIGSAPRETYNETGSGSL